MNIPNDLPDGAPVYFAEYSRAGGPDHAAKSYALACVTRDTCRKRAAEIALKPTPSVSDRQVMRACVTMADDASKTAEELREALPQGSKPQRADDDPDGMFALGDGLANV